MTLSAIHNDNDQMNAAIEVVCDIGGYDFVSYSQQVIQHDCRDGSCL